MKTQSFAVRIQGRLFSFCILLSFAFLFATPSHAIDLDKYPAMQPVVKTLVKDYGYSLHDLKRLFATVEIKEKVYQSTQRPAEKLAWHQYRRIFITQQRIEKGLSFIQQFKEDLARAEEIYGVPATVIAAIIGVETDYGRNFGKYRVIDSLTTLIHYNVRRKFFSSELISLFQLTQEEDIDILTVKGSYSGAMGWPQFISSSYRHYAIDFSGDGRRDLLNQPVDAIGSVGNYLAKHHWRRNQPIVDEIATGSNIRGASKFINKGLKTVTNYGDLARNGIRSKLQRNTTLPAAVIKLEYSDHKGYQIAFHNFFVITTYNRSTLYAMAVYQLHQALRDASG